RSHLLHVEHAAQTGRELGDGVARGASGRVADTTAEEPGAHELTLPRGQSGHGPATRLEAAFQIDDAEHRLQSGREERVLLAPAHQRLAAPEPQARSQLHPPAPPPPIPPPAAAAPPSPSP